MAGRNTPERRRPLIRYAGSAAETSIGSPPIGHELGLSFGPNNCFVKRPFSGWLAEVAFSQCIYWYFLA
jgi:hypothetical protein